MSEVTRTKDQRPKTKNWDIWIFAILIALFYLFGLTLPLVGPDEPRYAQVAREMFERGDWITPTLGGFHWFEKPALLYWLQIASYHLFGVNEFAARFGSALFGLGTIASLWILGRKIAAEHTERSDNGSEATVPSVAKNFGNWLALIAASSIGIIVFSRGASFDIILTFPITAALVSYFILDRAETRPLGSVATGESEVSSLESGVRCSGSRLQTPDSRLISPRSFTLAFLPLASFYFFIGLALLAKGLVGIVFPFAIVAFFHVLSWKRPSRTLILSLFWGTGISLLVASLWYVPMYLTHGSEFINEFFIQHHFQRYTSNKYFHPQPFYFFFWVLPLMTIPWLPFFIGGIWHLVRTFIPRKDAETRREVASNSDAPFPTSLCLFAVAWLLVPLVFFSFSGSKLPGYILPSLPPALIITAVCVSKFVGTSRRRGTLIVAIATATFLTIVVLLVAVVPKYADNDSVKRLIAEAGARGYSNLEVLSQHTISHNAEFYAAGRLLRDVDGKQMRLYGPQEVLNEIRRRNGQPVLVLVPNEWAKQTLESPLLSTELIASNAELSILVAREHQP